MEIYYEVENKSIEDEKLINKRKPRSDIGKPREKRVIKKEKHKIMIVLNGNSYTFKNPEEVKRYFEDENNILDGKKIKENNLSEEIKYILKTPFLLRRLCYINNGNENYFKKSNTRQKYLSIPNLKIVPLC